VAELRLDLKSDSVNKFNRETLTELGEVLGLLKGAPEVRGLLVTSAKDCFVVGADVTIFHPYCVEMWSGFLFPPRDPSVPPANGAKGRDPAAATQQGRGARVPL
jgi:enoyl-CoA hydratase/carnithine racemase